jgi:2-polyprenyl-6-hydroxyphenyl methylase/3-demethylubiquinone-9 3-methyltransferase
MAEPDGANRMKSDPKPTFSFGRNWQTFLKSLDEERCKNAQVSLTDFLGTDGLRDKSFVDVGCGSGLFSYAAYRLGAARVVSFDVDPFSVQCCKYVRDKAGSPPNWTVFDGSILDDGFVSRLGVFDIVYSWGVLHHTGSMWEAIKNAARLVNKNGYYYIAIYNRVEGRRGSEFWLRVKKLYNASPPAGKKLLEAAYIGTYFAYNFAKLRNPFPYIRNYKSVRGMKWRTDITDWLGGYPYEFATKEEIVAFMKSEFPAFELVKVQTTDGLGNNWFLFRRNEA